MANVPRRRPLAWAALERPLLAAAAARPFHGSELAAAPEPVRRYFASAIAEGTPLAGGALLRMRGRIKLGRWLPFRARQLLAPGLGTVWMARVGGVVTGSDSYVDGHGAMAWRLLGVVPLMRAAGEDTSRSAAGRVAGESIWVPTAVAGRQPPPARAVGDDRVAVEIVVGTETIEVEHRIADDGRLLSSRLQRWGDPEGTGEFQLHPFGLEATAWRTFGGVTIPSAGRAGWHYGTDRWGGGEFFRYQITNYTLLVGRS